jgi:hypothetical protein
VSEKMWWLVRDQASCGSGIRSLIVDRFCPVSSAEIYRQRTRGTPVVSQESRAFPSFLRPNASATGTEAETR